MPAQRTVGELAALVRAALDQDFGDVLVAGELSNFRRYGSGHWYFTLKDEQAQIKAAMFAGNNRRVRFEPRDGDAVLVRGRVDLYAARGDLQLVAATLEPLGAGRLQAAFEALKARLEAEGLFDPARKRPLPAVPRRIGIVTSPQAAALQDMLRILDERDPTLAITISPARVQGEGAAASIAAALDRLGASDVEVILCGRGGGSLEDLWAFNEEVVARAIARCPVPVVSAVGHETDFTIADFVADRRAPTPTAAAELAVPVRADLLATVDGLRGRLGVAWRRQGAYRRDRLALLRARLLDPRRRLERDAQRLDELRARLEHAARAGLARRRQRLDTAGARLQARGPADALLRARRRVEELRQRLARGQGSDLAARRAALEGARRALLALGPAGTLSRGYALATDAGGRVLRDAQEVAVGERVTVRLDRGALDCDVVAARHGDVDLRGRAR